jgi:hypothetical protein
MLKMVASSRDVLSCLWRLLLTRSLPFHHPWRRIGYIRRFEIHRSKIACRHC